MFFIYFKGKVFIQLAELDYRDQFQLLNIKFYSEMDDFKYKRLDL